MVSVTPDITSSITRDQVGAVGERPLGIQVDVSARNDAHPWHPEVPVGVGEGVVDPPPDVGGGVGAPGAGVIR